MAISQKQIRNFRVLSPTNALSIGRVDEVIYIESLNEHFYYTINAALVDNGTTIIPATGTNAHWVQVGAIAVQNNYAATVNPLVTDDSAAGYEVGSHWINVTLDTSYVCVDATATAAIWKDTTAASIQNNYAATVNPAVTDDSAVGYEVGSRWVNITLDTSYVCVDATATAAIWKETTYAKNNFLTNIDPTNTDDSGVGYSIGSIWINTAFKRSFICVQATPGSAVWVQTSIDNLSAIVGPTTADDVSLGYSVGSVWVNTTLDVSYICVDNTGAAAVWLQTSNINEELNNFTAIVGPTATDDTALGYSIGSIWVDTVANDSFICVDATAATAIWKQTNAAALLNNFTAIVAPTIGNDTNAGYAANSVWFDTVTDDLYICSDATVGAAVWVKVSNDTQNNFTASAGPGPLNDNTQGYNVGSMWIDTLLSNAYTCTSTATGTAVWEFISPVTPIYDGNAENTIVSSVNLISPNMAAGNPLSYVGNFALSGPINAPLGINVFVGAVLKIIVNTTATGVTVTFAPTYKDANGVSLGAVTFANGDVKCYNFRAVKASGVTTMVQIDDTASSGSSATNNLTAIIPPTITDDISAGYSVGSTWYDTVLHDTFISTSVAVGAAVWVKVSDDVLNNFAATVAPLVTDGISLGYDAGSLWLDTVTGYMYICSNNAISAAVWKVINLTPIQNSYVGFTVDPTSINDSTQGYSISSRILNSTTGEMFLCADATPVAAVWIQISSDTHHNSGAINPPTVTDDSASRYSTGSIWVDNTANTAYICVDATAGVAIWDKISNDSPLYDGNVINTSSSGTGTSLTPDIGANLFVRGQFTANAVVNAPLGTAILLSLKGHLLKITLSNVTAGVPITVTFNPIYVLASGTPVGIITLAAGEITTMSFRYGNNGTVDTFVLTDGIASAKNNFAATVAPAGTDDITAGYTVGSVWIDTTNDHNYTCVDSTAGSAIWKAQPVAPISPRDVMQVKIPGNNLFAGANTAANMSTLVYQSGTSLTNAVNSGVGGLKAGVTYKMTAVFWYPGNAASANFTIRDMTAGVNLTTAIQMFMPTYGMTVETFFTPTVTTEVSLTTLTGGSVYLGAGTSLSVEEVITFPASASPLDAISVMPNSGTNTVTISNTTTTGVVGKAVDLSAGINNSVYDPSSLIDAAGTSIILKNSGRYEFSYSWHAAGIERVELVKNGVSVLYGISRSTAAAQPAETFSGMFDGVAGDIIQLSSNLAFSNALEGFSFTLKELPPYTSIAPDGPLPKYSMAPTGSSARPNAVANYVVFDVVGATNVLYDPQGMGVGDTITIPSSGEYLIGFNNSAPVAGANVVTLFINGVSRMINTKLANVNSGTVEGYFDLVAGDTIRIHLQSTNTYNFSCRIAKQA